MIHTNCSVGKASLKPVPASINNSVDIFVDSLLSPDILYFKNKIKQQNIFLYNITNEFLLTLT